MAAAKVTLARLLFTTLVTLASSVAFGANQSPVRVEIPEGELSFDGAQLIDLLRIELGTEVDDARTHAPVENERVAVVHVQRARATEGNRWSVTFRAGPGVKPVQREVDLGDYPWGARARGLALAISELIRAETATAPLVPKPSGDARPVPPKTTKAEKTVETPAEPTETGVGFLLSMGGRTCPTMGAWLFDPRLGFSWGSRQFRIRLDGGYMFGNANTTVGSVSVSVPSAGLGLTFTAGSSNVTFEVGPRAEVGYALLTGNSPDPSVTVNSTSHTVGAASLIGALRIALSRDWRLGIGIEAGYVFSGVEADANGTRVVAFAGPMFGAGLQLLGGL